MGLPNHQKHKNKYNSSNGAENSIIYTTEIQKYEKIIATKMQYQRSSRFTTLDNIRIKIRTRVEHDALDLIEEKRLQLYGQVRRTDKNKWQAKATN